MTEQLKPILEQVKDNQAVFDMFVKADSVINEMGFEKITVSISGGSDSDVMLDVVQKVDFNHKCQYINMNTGLEYQATKDHLKYLEDRYGIEIIRLKPKKPIPVVCKEFGQPFLSKMVSENLRRLQQVNFDWNTTDTFEEALLDYPKSKSPLKFWYNQHKTTKTDFDTSQFNINFHSYLKEYIQENPPMFKIDNVCCRYTKKDLIHDYQAKNGITLSLSGERKSEGGARSYKKTCTHINPDGISRYKPLFWITNDDKEWYEMKFNIIHSRCYTTYGLKRTGCVGCPYGSYHDNPNLAKAFEPNLAKACETVFKDAYAYTEAYYAYRKRKRLEKNADPDQMRMEI